MRRRGLLTLTLVLAGCGSTAGQDTPKEAIRAADAGTARVSITYDHPRSDNAATHEGLSATGVVDFRNDRRRIVTNLPITQTRHENSTSFEVDFQLGPNVQITIGDVTYVRSDGFGPAGKPWSRTTTSELGPFQLHEVVLRDPVRALARLRSISDDVSVAPGEVVREVETVAYRGEVSLAKMREQASTTEREILDEWMDGLPADRTMRFEAYVDADGFPRRVRITDLLEISTTIEFYDLGVNAPIEPPPPELVMTGEEMLEWMQAHFEASGTDCEPKSAGEGSSGVFQYPDDAENRTGERVTLCVSESATAEEPESESEADEPQP